MTRRDRDKLEALARKRARVAKSMVGERVKILKRDVEDQLSAEHAADDELWRHITAEAQKIVRDANDEISAICAGLSIPEKMAPYLRLDWYNRGENASASRRAELRKLAYIRIDAAAETAKVDIDASLVDVEEELVRGGLDSAAAVAALDSMPSAEDLLPRVELGEVDPDRRPVRQHWTPPLEAAGELLTPTTASGREAKRKAIEAALTANPALSNRAIAQQVGADHKTVGKLRATAGEFPTDAGEIPTEPGESDA